MPSSWTQNYYHLVFSTKHREPRIGSDLKERLYPFFGGILRELRSQLIACNGMADHVHLLIRFAPDVATAQLAKEVKSRSTNWIQETFDAGFYWQKGYGGFTVSRSVLEDVEAYIRNQEAHHRSMTFKEEFLELLRRHGIEFDERYVFD